MSDWLSDPFGKGNRNSLLLDQPEGRMYDWLAPWPGSPPKQGPDGTPSRDRFSRHPAGLPGSGPATRSEYPTGPGSYRQPPRLPDPEKAQGLWSLQALPGERGYGPLNLREDVVVRMMYPSASDGLNGHEVLGRVMGPGFTLDASYDPPQKPEGLMAEEMEETFQDAQSPGFQHSGPIALPAWKQKYFIDKTGQNMIMNLHSKPASPPLAEASQTGGRQEGAQTAEQNEDPGTVKDLPPFYTTGDAIQDTRRVMGEFGYDTSKLTDKEMVEAINAAPRDDLKSLFNKYSSLPDVGEKLDDNKRRHMETTSQEIRWHITRIIDNSNNKQKIIRTR